MTKVTLEEVEASIAKEEYIHIGRKTSVYLLTLKNGFEVVGLSSCVDPKDYDSNIGKKIAREKAIDKVWELLGFEKQAHVLPESEEVESTLQAAMETAQGEVLLQEAVEAAQREAEEAALIPQEKWTQEYRGEFIAPGIVGDDAPLPGELDPQSYEDLDESKEVD